MKIRHAFLIIFIFISITNVSGQEICDNGIDDNNDGLIDLNDTVACKCNGINAGSVAVPSLIPNPSFEQMNCCPSSYSQMSCATGWIQASNATSDYNNTCGFVASAAIAAGLVPFPNGNGAVSAIFMPTWEEYVGSCLLQPMHAGQSYTIQMNIASTPIDGNGGVCNGGNIYYGPIDIVIYGSTNCSNMPFNSTGCPPATWQILGSTNYTPVPSWGIINITFVPPVDIYAIIIGAPCVLPATYNNGPPGICTPYFYYDNLLLNTTSSFSPLTINHSGANCQNNIVLDSHVDTAGGTWQWFRNGIALVGETDSILNVSANGYGTGLFSARYSIGGNCQIISDSVIAYTPGVAITSHSNVSCSGGSDGSATATANLGPTSTIDYSWNTSPAQLTATANNLSAGTYTVTVTYSDGCTSSDSVTLTQVAPVSVNNPQTICSGQNYTLNAHNYSIAGTYYDTLTTIAGCDSVIITDLSENPVYNINNPQSICNGQIYTINNHNYSAAGTYYDTIPTISSCDSVIETQITINQFYHVNNPQTVCSGQSYAINSHSYSIPGTYYDTLPTNTGCDSIIITQLNQNVTYTVDNPRAICSGQSYSFNSHNYSNSGTYYDTLTSVAGCDSIIATRITSNPLPQLSFAHPDDLCIDAPVIPLTYAIPVGGDYSGAGVINNNFDPKLALAGTHLLTYRYSDPVTNCENTATERITVHPLPVVEMTIYPKATTLENPGITFTDLTHGSVNSSWNFGDDSLSQVYRGVHIYSDTGYFNISLSVTDNHGCKNSSSDIIYIGPELSFYVPNAFTPNGDGNNETFNGIGLGVRNYSMTIYDRWGNDIFHTNDLNQPWSGKNIQEGVYVYKIELDDAIGVAHEYVGRVSLVR